MVRETSSIVKGKIVQDRLSIGSSKTASAVSTTLGPFGKNIAITKIYNNPHVTKDGVTGAHAINLKDPIENVAAQIIKEAAARTARIAGDGTTSTVVLTDALVQACQEYLSKSEQSVTSLKNELQEAGEIAVAEVLKLSQEVGNKIKEIALVSSNGDEFLSELVTEAYNKIGNDGIITVVESKNYKTFIDTTSGIKLDRSHISPALVNEKSVTSHKNPNILVTNLDITTQDDVFKLLSLTEPNNTPLLVICNDLSNAAIEIVAYNKITRGVNIEIIRAPFIADARNEACRDLAIATGATFIEKEAGWNIASITPSVLGTADSVEISLKETNIIGRHGNEELIDSRVAFYKEKIENDHEGLAVNYKKRLGMLTSGAAVIYVGGTNDVEVTEKKDKLDDTIKAVKAALDQGYVKGGGFTYRAAAEKLPTSAGASILKECLKAITNAILENKDLEVTEEDIEFFNLEVVDGDIIDPTLVVTSTITNAIGAATMIFTIDCVIIKEEGNGN